MINIIGLGYIGLPTALMFAAHGEQTMGTDCKEEVITHLRDGVLDTEEQGMSELYAKAKGNIVFSTQYAAADMYIVAVPTPYNKNSKK